MQRNWFLFGALLILTSSLFAQSAPRYWIFFSDKGEMPHYAVEELMSTRAQARRATQGVLVDAYDYPLSTHYLQSIEALGIQIHRQSRWLNAVSAPLSTSQIQQVAKLPFVKGIQAVAVGQRISEWTAQTPTQLLDTPTTQLEMIDLDQLHQMDFRGQDMLVAVFDNGYYNVNQMSVFSHLFPAGSSNGESHIIATKDLVDDDESVFHSCIHCKHGTYVFSILAAAEASEGFSGSAPQADFILLRTENDYSETHCEEDNWIAAAEFADSMGAQIFTTSLGYYQFDTDINGVSICPENGTGAYALARYTFADLDGHTPVITRGADIAASRGILVVNSAGNNGESGLVAPADGDSVMAVGSVDLSLEASTFSSRGPTGDGRIKPDVAVLGRGVFAYNPNNTIRTLTGTSGSAPIVSGMAACLWQQHPSASAMEVFDAIRQSGTQAEAPDNLRGYGIPNAVIASQILTNLLNERNFSSGPTDQNGHFWVTVPAEFANDPEASLEVIDLMGRAYHIETTRQGQGWEVQLQEAMTPGYYLVRLLHPSKSTNGLFAKIVLRAQ